MPAARSLEPGGSTLAATSVKEPSCVTSVIVVMERLRLLACLTRTDTRWESSGDFSWALAGLSLGGPPGCGLVEGLEILYRVCVLSLI